MELWQSLLVAFGGNAALLLVMGFLGRSLMSNALDKDLEKFKGNLQLASTEHEIRFSKLHEKRAEVIAELYKLLVKATWEAESFTSPMEWAGEPDKKEKYNLAMKAIVEYFRFFDLHRIYISPDLCGQLEGFANKLRSPVMKFGIWVRHEHLSDISGEKKDTAWNTAWDSVKNDIPQLRAAIEAEFRLLLGSDGKAS